MYIRVVPHTTLIINRIECDGDYHYTEKTTASTDIRNPFGVLGIQNL